MESTEYNFEAKIVYCRYYNEDTNYGIYNFSTKEDLPYLTSPEFDAFDTTHHDDSKFGTLVGKMQQLSIGCKYKVTAKIIADKRYGMQYSTINIISIAPKTAEDQMAFLKVIVNESVAENILKKYPNLVNDVVDGKIDKIDYSDIKGVAEKTWEKIKDKILNNYVISDLVVMLKPLGVSYQTIGAMLKHESNPSILKQKIEEDPYYLTKFQGFGFKRVDELVKKLKPEKINSMSRLVSFVTYFFRELGENNGDTWCTKETLLNAILENVPECKELIDNLFHMYIITIENDYVGLASYRKEEWEIYNTLHDKIVKPGLLNITQESINNAIKKAEDIQGFQYTDEQIKVINNTLKHNVSIITGKAGVGKSSIMRAIMIALEDNHKIFESCALSAMAAKRISEASGYGAKTIHRLLESQGYSNFGRNKDKPINADVVIIDEGSMIGASLFLSLVRAIGENTVVIISGDHKQLPPIGYGNIFSDLIDIFYGGVVNKLTKPMRQATQSGILVDANKIRENINPIKEEIKPKMIHGKLQDMYYMFRNDRDTLTKIAINTYMSSINELGTDNVVIITPRKQGCNNSSLNINNKIQSIIMEGKSNDKMIEYGSNKSKKIYVGDKVLQIVNNYQKRVFNGEIGYVIGINKHPKDARDTVCKVRFNDVTGEGYFNIVEYTYSELEELELAYALTCHKIQGAGIHTVIGIVDNTHYSLLDNCMLYTMMTRAKKRCLLLAEPSAFRTCIRKSHNDRKTWLSLGDSRNNRSDS